ncbi:MAG TPA: hypothetical protein VEB59_00315, partial [Gemmatimonadales bacterium]|nr:hypothetical protein [Gemmatimonadales bacterium]
MRLVTHDSVGRLAAVELNDQLGSPLVTHVPLDSPSWAPLWQGPGGGRPDDGPTLDLIVSFLADDTTEGGRRWLAGARAAFPGAEVVLAGPPGSATRAALWNRFRVGELGAVAPRVQSHGPLLLSVGAGGRHKRWPLERWSRLTDAVVSRPGAPRVQIIAGPVEAEQFS